MRRTTAHVILGLWCTAALVGSLPGQTNFDFERGAETDTVPGWFCPTRGYKIELMRRPGDEGHCVRFAPKSPSGARVANLMQFVDAEPYRGKFVRLSGELKNDGAATSRTQMWMRVDRPKGKPGFKDLMQDRPITSKKWKRYEIVGKVADDATRIAVGLMKVGTGGAWLDNVTLEAVDVDEPPPEGPRPLRDRALLNVVAFAKVYGYVRFFHPSTEGRGIDWDWFVIDGVRQVESAASAAELSKKLGELFAFAAPTVRFAVGGQDAKTKFSAPHASLRAPEGKAKKGISVVAWEHFGIGLGPGSLYRSNVVEAPLLRGPLALFGGKPKAADLGDPGKPLRFDLPGGVSCSVPIALYMRKKGTLPHMRGAQKGRPVLPFTANDRATRLGVSILAWNVFQHFYPYFDVVEVDWHEALSQALQTAATDRGEAEFLDTLRVLVAKLQDGHGYVSHSSDPRTGFLPVEFAAAEGALVVDRAAPSARGIKRGDVVRKIDGRPAAEVIAEVGRRVSASTAQFRRSRTMTELRRGRSGQEVVMLIASGEKKIEKSVVLQYGMFVRLPEARPKKIAELEDGIYYVDIGRITTEDYQAALPDLAKAKGIVFDFRGYPGKLDSHTFFGHLIDKPVQSAQWHVPVPKRPDQVDMKFRALNRWNVRPRSPHLTAKKVFITDGRAISYAESCMGIVEHYKLGTIVGEATAGTNGNVNPLTLPAGYRVMWTGMKVLKHDGTQHHRIGNLPTVPVKRTIAGIRQGKDEYLDRAVTLLRE